MCVCVCVVDTHTHTHTQMHGAIPDCVIVKKLTLRAQRKKTQNYHTHDERGGGGGEYRAHHISILPGAVVG